LGKRPQKGRFREKRLKSLILAKNPKNGVFWAFRAPWALPGTLVPRGFYINPSRRGPVPGLGGGLLTPRSGVAGVSPIGASGALPGGRRSRPALADRGRPPSR